MNYTCSDATWHTLLTIRAYDGTPWKSHLFLPIVSLGAESDKHIPWGATIPDKNGNYYYTSFSAAGYFAPWAFCKVFRLPYTEKSLYIFNAFLLILSQLSLYALIFDLFKRNKYCLFICLFSQVLYITLPEILHSMGIAYWHQSIMQVTLLLQLLTYNRRINGNKPAAAAFFALCLINPYIEWSGYVANALFCIADIIRLRHTKMRAFLSALSISSLTIFSLLLFSLQYIAVVESREQFIHISLSRFFARNITSSIPFKLLFIGYIQSFLPLLLVLLAEFLLLFIPQHDNASYKKHSVLLRHKALCFVAFFLILENILMKEHAIYYTYDRMKMSFFLILLACEGMNILSTVSPSPLACFPAIKRYIAPLLIVFALCLGERSVKAYKKLNNAYIWNAPYRTSNIVLRNFINTVYPDSIFALDSCVRGYVNCLFNRGIYESYRSIEPLIPIAEKNNKRYIVFLHDTHDRNGGWNMFSLSAEVYDREHGTTQLVKVKDGILSLSWK